MLKSYSGTLTLSGPNTYTGKTSIAGATTAGAGTLEVSSFNSVNGGTPLLASSSLGAPTTVANGTIDLGGPTNVQGGATLRYIGTGETTDRVVNVQMGANTSRTIDASGSGLLKFTSAFTSVGGTFATTTVQLIGTGDGEITQGLPFAFPNLTKNGSGTWTLGGRGRKLRHAHRHCRHADPQRSEIRRGCRQRQWHQHPRRQRHDRRYRHRRRRSQSLSRNLGRHPDLHR